MKEGVFMKLEEKAASESAVIMNQLVLPHQANQAGRMHGGEVMKLMDSAAGVVGARHSHHNVVTASVTQLSFIEPIFIGDLVICLAQLIYTGKTSMEVYVSVEAEKLETGVSTKVSEGYFIMVALDRNGRSVAVPPLKLETEEERLRFEDARKRIDRMKSSTI
jgi:acyl-CoA hydrolase